MIEGLCLITYIYLVHSISIPPSFKKQATHTCPHGMILLHCHYSCLREATPSKFYLEKAFSRARLQIQRQQCCCSVDQLV